MSDDELLRESLSRAEQALAAERSRREEAEAALAGIQVIAEARDLAAADAALLAGLQPLLRYEAAALLVRDRDRAEEEALHAEVVGDAALAGLRLVVGPVLTRVLAGKTIALYDVGRSPELAALAAVPGVRSALCVPLRTSERDAVLIGVHPEPARFSPRQVDLACGLAQTVARMLESLVAREHAQRRRLADERAAALASSNEALRAQLETIREQQRQIERLAAPVLQLGPQILGVPLIGDLDREALRRVTQALLEAITARGARAVIVDLTGLEVSGGGVPERLNALIRAAELVGARCLFTGLRARVAAAFADAEVPFQVRAFATLAEGLEAARRELLGRRQGAGER